MICLGAVQRERRIHEMFTEAEAEAFDKWLQETHGTPCAIGLERLPIEGNSGSVSTVPSGGGPNYYVIHETPGYPLPFKVQGSFDTHLAECVKPENHEFLVPALRTSSRVLVKRHTIA